MSKAYKTISAVSGRGAYDFPYYISFEVRRDGRRFRICHGGFQWRGNEGGYHEAKPTYFDREKGRELLAALRRMQIADLKGELPAASPLSALIEIA